MSPNLYVMSVTCLSLWVTYHKPGSLPTLPCIFCSTRRLALLSLTLSRRFKMRRKILQKRHTIAKQPNMRPEPMTEVTFLKRRGTGGGGVFLRQD
jgi:hypothetical protein